MALNWDAFINAESIDLQNDQWSDFPPSTQHTPHNHQMPKSVSTDTSGSSPEDITNLDSFLSGFSADPFLDDCLLTSNDYFLSDLEVLQPFNSIGKAKSTNESSPEPSTAVASYSNSQSPTFLSNVFDQTSQMSPAQSLAPQRSGKLPSHPVEVIFPKGSGSSLVEDIPSTQSLINTSTTQLDSNSFLSTNQATSKRTKNKPDILSACWTSPLCPNHSQDGPPPNPSTCGGGCSPFLFANEDALPAISDLLDKPQPGTTEEGVVEIQLRRKKRTESDTASSGPTSRNFSRNEITTASPFGSTEGTKSEGNEESFVHEPPHANDDEKPKARRRLPHNQVERKYRESLNTQLDSLRRVVPALQQDARACDGLDIEDLPAPSKPSKAVILASATAYIKQQEKDKKSLIDENQLLRTRVKALQALVKCDDCSLMQYVMDLKIKQAG